MEHIFLENLSFRNLLKKESVIFLRIVQSIEQARNQPSSWGEHEQFWTPKKGFFAAVPQLCPLRGRA